MLNTHHIVAPERGSHSRLTRTEASSLFRRYKQEFPKEVRKVDVQQDESLEQIRDAWIKLRYKSGSIDRYYLRICTILKELKYSSKDVEKFSIALADFQDDERFSFKAGTFLSALVNNCQDQDFVIQTKHFSVLVAHLGLRNIKNVTINGDVDHHLAYRMKKGTIVVNGNVGDNPGLGMRNGAIIINGNAGEMVGLMMKNGTIIVNGNTDECAGACMFNGSIKINGNTGRSVGFMMQGGEVHVNGEFESIDDNYFVGRIYQMGELICERGIANVR